jgi:hypothetical protein
MNSIESTSLVRRERRVVGGDALDFHVEGRLERLLVRIVPELHQSTKGAELGNGGVNSQFRDHGSSS